MQAQQLEELLAYAKDTRPWFAEEGALDSEVWERVGRQLGERQALEEAERPPSQVLWELGRDSLTASPEASRHPGDIRRRYPRVAEREIIEPFWMNPGHQRALRSWRGRNNGHILDRGSPADAEPVLAAGAGRQPRQEPSAPREGLPSKASSAAAILHLGGVWLGELVLFGSLCYT